MAQAYVPIQTVTVGSGGAASIEFTNIPQTYTDLLLKVSARESSNNGAILYYYNGSTSSFTERLIQGSGSAVTSANYSGQSALVNMSNTTANTFGNTEIYIPNYTSNNYKVSSQDSVIENNATAAYMRLNATLWSNTAAITSIKIYLDSGQLLVQHSTATLYGIGGARASGGTITADGTHTYHTFTSSGTFTALEKLQNVEVLVVAGGGGGNNSAGEDSGGGGAGGLCYGFPRTIGAGVSTSAIVGAGGATNANANGSNGGNSYFGNIVALGGGYGGGNSIAGGSGGSGGGGGANAAAGGAATQGSGVNYIGYGNAGGSSTNSGTNGAYNISGGGGAGAVGESRNRTGTSEFFSGNGGVGLSNWQQWAFATNTGDNGYYAGGGGGGYDSNGPSGAPGIGGRGGGGNGGRGTAYAATAGTANTGGGGGGRGSGATFTSAAGGSGIVIVRYPN